MRMIIDEEQVSHLAEFFRAPSFADSFYEEVVPKVSAPVEAVARAVFWAAAICHNTKGGLRGDFGGRTYRGWDYLLRAFCGAADDDPATISVDSVLKLEADSLLQILVRKVSDPVVRLTDLEARAALLRRLAAQLSSQRGGRVAAILEASAGVAGGATGAYSQLATFDAYGDPLKKKSSVFLMALHFAKIWTATDQHELFPMIDYHRLRILCRTGCIVIKDSLLLEDLVAQRPVDAEAEKEMRELAFTVCKRIVALSGTPMFEFDILLWAHARSCCRHQPVCVGRTVEDSSFYRYVSFPFNGECVFQAWCAGARDQSVRSIWEPLVQTEHY